MSKPFNIQDFMSKNKFEIGSIKKEVGNTISKGGHNDLRKTNYDVKIKDGKLDLYTHKEIISESKLPLKELSSSQETFLRDIYLVSKKYQSKLNDSEMREVFETAKRLYKK